MTVKELSDKLILLMVEGQGDEKIHTARQCGNCARRYEVRTIMPYLGSYFFEPTRIDNPHPDEIILVIE